jgi:hypothetical protein
MNKTNIMKKIYFLLVFILSFSVSIFAQTATIGSGTTATTSTGSDPIDGYYESFRYQVVYTAAELTAAGLVANDILTGLGFSIAGDYGGGDLLGYTIKIGNTTATNSAAHNTDATATVKNPFNYNPAVTAAGSFDMITFNSNFTWNGTSNILIDICTDGPNPFAGPYGSVRTIAASTADGSRYYRVDTDVSCNVATNSTNSNKPQIRFSYIPINPPTCSAVPSVSNSSITATAASHSWGATSPAPSVGYQWAVTTSNTPPAAGTATTALTASSSSLMPSTTYYLHVRSDCGANGFSSWNTSGSFTTLCVNDNIPYTMPITAVTAPALPSCTSIENIGNLPNTWASAAAAQFGGTINAAYTMPVMAYIYNSTNPANDWLYTNGLNLTAGTSYTLKYKYSNDLGTLYPEAMKVGIGTANNAAAMTTILANYPSISGSTAQLASNIFTVPTTGIYYIGFHAYSDADQDVLILDDVEVILTPNCTPVTGLTVATTPTAANLAWTAVPAAANGYEYVVDAIATSPTVAGTPVATNLVSVPGTYTLGTNYYAHVRAICSGTEFSEWTNTLFALPPACLLASDYITPVNGATVAYQPNVLISWNNVPGATSYDIYVDAGAPPTIATTLLGNLPAAAGATSGAFLNTALPATQYVWYVVGKNAGGGALGCGLPNTYTTAAAASAPANDDCTGAISLPVNANDLCAVTTAGTTLGATASTETAPSCNATGTNDDVWYTFVATGATHIINITGVSAGATMSSQVYSGACGSLALVTGGCSSTFPYTITGLTATTTYTVRVNTVSDIANNKSNFVICVGAPPTAPPANDDATGAIALIVGAGCSSQFTNALATAGATEVYPSCSGVKIAPVWFSFVAPASGTARVTTDITGGTFSDSKVAIFSVTNPADYSTFIINSCDDDGGSVSGSGFLSVVYTAGLTPGNTYYIAVDKYSSFTSSGSFCITVDEINTTMLATANTCASSFQTPSANGATAYLGKIPLMDANSKLIALVRSPAPTGASVDEFSVAQNISTGAVRVAANGTPYLNRNFRIVSTQTNVEVQLFFLLSELAALNAVDNTVNIANLGGTRQSGAGEACQNNFVAANGANAVFSQFGNTTSNGVGFISLTAPSFSNFYLHKQSSVLPIRVDYITGRKSGAVNNLDWKVTCTNSPTVELTLERSGNGSDFKAINTQNETQTRCDQPFAYTDASPLQGKNYYRVKVVGVDGIATYSRVVTLLNADKGFELISIAPNPVNEASKLNIASAKADKVTITIVDKNGKVASTTQVVLVAGSNTIPLASARLASGSYHVIVTNEDGERKNLSFVK